MLSLHRFVVAVLDLQQGLQLGDWRVDKPARIVRMIMENDAAPMTADSATNFRWAQNSSLSRESAPAHPELAVSRSRMHKSLRTELIGIRNHTIEVVVKWSPVDPNSFGTCKLPTRYCTAGQPPRPKMTRFSPKQYNVWGSLLELLERERARLDGSHADLSWGPRGRMGGTRIGAGPQSKWVGGRMGHADSRQGQRHWMGGTSSEQIGAGPAGPQTG